MSDHECLNCTSPMDAVEWFYESRRVCRECEELFALEEWEVYGDLRRF